MFSGVADPYNLPYQEEEELSEAQRLKKQYDKLESMGAIRKPEGGRYTPSDKKFEAKPGSKTEEQIKAIIDAGADATNVGGLGSLKGKNIRVETPPEVEDVVATNIAGTGTGEGKGDADPGTKIDRAGVQSQLDAQRKRIMGMEIPSSPNTTQLETLQKQLRTKEEGRLTDIDKRLEGIPEERKQDLFALLTGISAQYATDPDARLMGQIGKFTEKGRDIYKMSKEQERQLKEKKTDLNVGLMKTDIANETAKINLKTKADQKRFENIVKKENAGLALTSAELKLRDTIANEMRANAAADTAKATLQKALKGKPRTDLSKEARVLAVNFFKDEVESLEKDENKLQGFTDEINKRYNKSYTSSEVQKVLNKAKKTMRTGTKETGTAGIAEYVALYKDASGGAYNQNEAVARYIIDYVGRY